MITWKYHEFKHCGVDYSDINQSKIYDSQHLMFRDYEKEFKNLLEFLALDNVNNMTLVDLGCGTGAISIQAAKKPLLWRRGRA
jgi:cyclopropane fatty-acyl-phospholipid synthase-like methyltransferase